VPDANGGVSVPLLNTRLLRSAVAARVTVTVYVLVVVPSCAVTTVVMVFAPTLREIAPDALPEAIGVPFTVMVAYVLLAVGVTVMLVTPFATLAV
jgi:hypothetical protein